MFKNKITTLLSISILSTISYKFANAEYTTECSKLVPHSQVVGTANYISWAAQDYSNPLPKGKCFASVGGIGVCNGILDGPYALKPGENNFMYGGIYFWPRSGKPCNWGNGYSATVRVVYQCK